MSGMLSNAENHLSKLLSEQNFQATLTAGILFFIVAFPDLFHLVDNLVRQIPGLGGPVGKNRILVLIIHTVVFMTLTYFINKILSQRVYSWMANWLRNNKDKSS